MSNIKINKTNDSQSINRVQQSDIKRTAKDLGQTFENKSTTGEDKINFSNAAVETRNLVDQLKDLPDIREEKVAALRQQISAGEFKPSNEDIADAILKDEK